MAKSLPAPTPRNPEVGFDIAERSGRWSSRFTEVGMAALVIPPDEKTLSLRNRVDTFYPGRGKSPVTSFNDIEFEHPGTLKGLKGNKVDYGTIYYLAQCEDRNEPPAGPESGRMLIATSCMCSEPRPDTCC